MTQSLASLAVKTLDEEQRLIEGVATTNTLDRVGDIVEPSGAQFALPLPFLLDHDHDQVVGEVEWAQVTRTGIRFRARIAKIAEPGPAKELVDRAWQFLKYGLRKNVSIGFRPLEWELLPSGGLRFTKFDWYELSAVGIPANADAVVESVKRAPQGGTGVARRKPSGRVVRLADPVGQGHPVVRLSDPVGEPKGHRVVKLDKADIRWGKAKAAAARHIATLKRHGIPLPVVKLALTPEEEVEAVIAAGRERRKRDAIRRAMNGRVSLRDPSGKR